MLRGSRCLLKEAGILPQHLKQLAREYRREGRPPLVIPAPPVVLTPANRPPAFVSHWTRFKAERRLERLRAINEALKGMETEIYNARLNQAFIRARKTLSLQKRKEVRRKNALLRMDGLAMKLAAQAKASAAKGKGGKVVAKPKAKAKDAKKKK